MVPAVLLLAGCGRDKKSSGGPLPLLVEIRSDTSRLERWSVSPAREARVWMARVAPARAPVAEPDLPEAHQDTVLPEPAAPALEIDDDLKPPILRSRAILVVPRHEQPRPNASVELDVRVDQNGSVTDALWAGGSRDPELVAAASDCALRMRFYPALQGGRAVPVWCRQRFDFPGP